MLFGTRTPFLAPLVSAEDVRDLHGVVLERLDVSILLLSPFARINAATAEAPLSGSLRRT